MHRHRHSILSAAATAAVLTLTAFQANATFRHWTGTDSTDWTDGNNWGGSGGFAPQQDLSTDVAFFDTVTSLDPNITTSQKVAATDFTTSHTISGASGQTLTLGTFLASGITFSVEASSGAVATFDLPVVAGLSNFDVVANDTSTITFNGALTSASTGTNTLNISSALGSSGQMSHVNINATASFSGALNVSGNTNVFLAANQQILGNYNINSGGISIDSASALGSSNINLGSTSGGAGSLTVSSTIDTMISNKFTIQSENFFGTLTGGGTITNSGSTLLTLSGPLQIGTAPSNIAQLTIGGTGNTTISGEINAVYSSNYEAGSSIVKTGTGTLTITGNNESTWGTNEQNNTGDLIVDQGAVLLQNGHAIGTKSTVYVESSGTLDLGGTSQTIGSLNNNSNDPGGLVTLGSATLTLNGGMRDANFSGVISGTGALVVTGDAFQILSGTNTYTGGTTITNGTLLAGSNVPVTGAGAFGNNNSDIIVGNSQTTTGAYVGIFGNNVTIAKNIQFSAGAAQSRGITSTTDNGVITGDLELAGSDILISPGYTGGSGPTGGLTISGSIIGTGGLVITEANGSGNLILTGNAAGENATRNITIVGDNLLIKDNVAAGTNNIVLGNSATDANGYSPGLYTDGAVTVQRGVTIGSSQARIGGYGDFASTFSGNIQVSHNEYVQLDAEGTLPSDSVTFSGSNHWGRCNCHRLVQVW